MSLVIGYFVAPSPTFFKPWLELQGLNFLATAPEIAFGALLRLPQNSVLFDPPFQPSVFRFLKYSRYNPWHPLIKCFLNKEKIFYFKRFSFSQVKMTCFHLSKNIWV